MLNNEPKLLKEVLHFFSGDLNRTQRVLLIYSLTKILVSCEEIDPQRQQITIAAGILSGLPLSSCKTFLICCSYVPSYQSDILTLLSLNKRRNHDEYSAIHQMLTEANALADVIIKSDCAIEKKEELGSLFKTEAGIAIFKTLIL